MHTSPERENRLTQLVERCLEDYESGRPTDLAKLQAEARDLWPDLQRCLRVMSRLDVVADLLGPEPQTEPLPISIGRFTILQLIGEGGFSRVYSAFDPQLRRTVAIKLLHKKGRTSVAPSDWIVREANSLAQLDDPHVVRVHELGLLDGHSYLVTEYVPGPSLMNVIAAMRSAASQRGTPAEKPPAGPGPSEREARTARRLEGVDDRARIVLCLARALAHCHASGILHRDLKPGNILLPSPERPVLIDFGLSHLSAWEDESPVTEALMGTALYLAPEQLSSGRTGAEAASDIYSLGLVLYELLTLRHPRTDPAQQPWTAAGGARDPVPARQVVPSLHRDLEAVVMKALDPDPRRRYASMKAFAEDLDAYLRGQTVAARRQSVLRTLLRRAQQHPRTIRAALAATGVTAMGFMAVAGLGAVDERRHFQGELADRAVAAAEAEEPSDIASIADWIEGSINPSKRLDAHWLSGSPVGALASATLEVRSSLRARLEDLLTKATRAALDPIPRTNRAAAVRALHRRWRDAIVRCARPGRVDRCVLRIPNLERLEKMQPGVFGDLEPVADWTAAAPGFYRATGSGGARESEFHILPDQLTLSATLRELSPRWLSRMRALEQADIGSAQFPPEHPFRPFSVSIRDVNFDDAASVLSPAEFAALRTRIHPSIQAPSLSGPAIVPWSYAQEIATRLGARLPTAAELWSAHLAGVITVEPAGSKVYWCSMPDPQGAVHYALRLRATPTDLADLEASVTAIPTNAVVPDVHLRITATRPAAPPSQRANSDPR